MTVQSRGPRSRPGGRSNSSRGPGWMLLTALLVLAILASSTLVFTNRVELLRLAVILSLWAAVMAAFVTVIYRRQSDVAQARARDMKFVYDLQLDREISARREYELSVEARLRRQLSREGLQASDEMAALRAELVSLRSQLEVMLGADLAPRPALGGDRIAVPMPPAPGRVESSRVTVVAEEIVTEETEYTADYAVESPIIDVSEEPVHEEPPVDVPPPAVSEPRVRRASRRPEPARFVPPPVVPPPVVPPPPPEAPWRPPEVRLGRHATGDGSPFVSRPAPAQPENPPPPIPPRGRHWVPPEAPTNPAGRHRPAGPVVEGPPAQEPAHGPAEPQGQHADGQSFADLMQRLQVDSPVRGGGRRRRED